MDLRPFIIFDGREPWVLPGGLTAGALVVLAERIRADAGEVLRYFTEQGVALKVVRDRTGGLSMPKR